MSAVEDLRVAKALDGVGYPASKDELIAYAERNGADERALDALRAVPEGSYPSGGAVVDAVPPEPGAG
ncbi:DUF2795 domain-containing protein [Allonocardiopsis opalescens]|uniref:Uncharacterized protein DUF2795 n=1 Tax=Allonocardiopsis opalescens TaxID=1144618 RepID=A0A2T0Q0M5_9ACTN|nr:DUF2795 domain-containing protein [Allonocardiopsis opalescens]PRX97316.1 uncharacterized protein DUF2795 [Allonocardiopsis opalescens]